MKIINIAGIIACVGLLFAPAGAISKEVQDVNVVNAEPVAVTVPDGVSVNVSSVYQFVGYGGRTEGWSPGLEGMHAQCQREADGFGLYARMCTTKEFWTSPNAVFPEEENAWIQPTIVGNYTRVRQDGTEEQYIIDFAGESIIIENGTATCAQWDSEETDSYRGMILSKKINSTTYGRVKLDLCDEYNYVTCCAPVN